MRSFTVLALVLALCCIATVSASYQMGMATYYHVYDSWHNKYYGGACGYGQEGETTNDGRAFWAHTIAIATDTFANGGACGKCFEIINANCQERRVVARVTNECPKASNPLCRNRNHFDMSWNTIQALACPCPQPGTCGNWGPDGRDYDGFHGIKFREVPCSWFDGKKPTRPLWG